MPKKDSHFVEYWLDGTQQTAGSCDQVKVHLWTNYGSVVVAVNKEGKVLLTAEDGDGRVLNTHAFDPREVVEPLNPNRAGKKRWRVTLLRSKEVLYTAKVIVEAEYAEEAGDVAATAAEEGTIDDDAWVRAEARETNNYDYSAADCEEVTDGDEDDA